MEFYDYSNGFFRPNDLADNAIFQTKVMTIVESQQTTKLFVTTYFIYLLRVL